MWKGDRFEPAPLWNAPSMTQRCDHNLISPFLNTLGEDEVSSSETQKLPLTQINSHLDQWPPWVEGLEQDAHPLCSL